MATTVRLTFYASDEAAATTAAAAAFARIAELNRILSDYDEGSELSRLCQKAGAGPQPVGPELFLNLDRAVFWKKESGGLFDVALAPTIRLWRRARKTKRLPTPAEIAAALALSQGDRIALDPVRRTAALRAGTLIDLGGIAKGYAGDELIAVLAKHGCPRALVAVGGDVVAGDPPPGETGWKVALNPFENLPALRNRTLLLANRAVSTAGDTAQFSMIGGRRYGHIVDPRTGRPVAQRRQATAVCRKGIDADALDTVCYLAGPDAFMPIAERCDGAAVLLAWLDDQGGSATRASSRWAGIPQIPLAAEPPAK